MAKSGKTTGKQSAKTAAAPVRSGGGHELVPVICSDCHEEFVFDSGVASERLVCPVCEHSAARPDDATLHRIAELRRQERTNFSITLVLVLVGAVSFASWALLMRNPTNADDAALFWGPVGVGGLSALVLMIFIFKYESNRWETYF